MLKDLQEDSPSQRGCMCQALPCAGAMALAWEPPTWQIGFKAGMASLQFDPSRLQLLPEFLLPSLP